MSDAPRELYRLSLDEVLTTCRHCGGDGCEIDPEEVGRIVRWKREGDGLALREVARRARCSAAYVSDLERGRRPWGGKVARLVLRIVGVDLVPPDETWLSVNVR